MLHVITQQLGDSAVVNWSTVNTALLLAAIIYLYRQARVVDTVRQLLLGAGGEDTGILGQIRSLNERTHELSAAMAKLDVTLRQLNDRLDRIEERDARDTALRVERRNHERGGA